MIVNVEVDFYLDIDAEVPEIAERKAERFIERLAEKFSDAIQDFDIMSVEAECD